jgi:hypothetical protein
MRTQKSINCFNSFLNCIQNSKAFYKKETIHETLSAVSNDFGKKNEKGEYINEALERELLKFKSIEINEINETPTCTVRSNDDFSDFIKYYSTKFGLSQAKICHAIFSIFHSTYIDENQLEKNIFILKPTKDYIYFNHNDNEYISILKEKNPLYCLFSEEFDKFIINLNLRKFFYKTEDSFNKEFKNFFSNQVDVEKKDFKYVHFNMDQYTVIDKFWKVEVENKKLKVDLGNLIEILGDEKFKVSKLTKELEKFKEINIEGIIIVSTNSKIERN